MVKNRIKCYLILVVWMFTGNSLNATIKLCGQVLDEDGNAVFAAKLYFQERYELVGISDENGHFCIDLPHALSSDSLIISFVGYRTQKIAWQELLSEQPLRIVLKEDWMALDAVVLAQNPEVSEEFSLEKLGKLDIYLAPVAAGDPLNALTVLPAATNTAESANPQFRGSAANASQVVLNGINIANPVRNTQMSGMGNFSLFNTELIQNMTVYSGNPPLNHANSLAGLVDIKTTQQVTQSQTQIAASMANLGVLRTQRITEDAFVQVYGNYQFSKPYLYLNNTQDMLQHFSSRDLGVNLHADIGKGSVNLYSYFINEDFEGKEYYIQSIEKSRAWKRRLFNVLNFHYQHARCFVELNIGNDFSQGNLHLGDNKSMLMKEQNYQANAKLKYFFNEQIYLQVGISEEYLQVNYHDKMDSCLSYHLPEVFAYVRWKKDKWTAAAAWRSKNAFQVHARYQLHDGGSLQASAGRYHAYTYPLTISPHICLKHSGQMSLDYDFRHEGTQLSAAIYHKQEKGDYYFVTEEAWQNTCMEMSGLELQAQQQWQDLQAGISLTSLYARMQKEGTWHRAYNDLPYWIKLHLCHTNEKFFSIACSAQLRSGLRYTPIIGGRFCENTQIYQPVYGQLHSARMEDYQRFDLSLTKIFFMENGSNLVAFASFNNIFNHHNVMGYLYNRDFSKKLASVPMQLYSIYFGCQWSF